MTTTDTTATTPPEPKIWAERVAAFAKTSGVAADVVTQAFIKLVGEPSDDNVATLADPDCVDDADLIAAFSDVPRAKVKKAAKELRAAVAPAPASAPSADTAAAFAAVLPTPPDDESFLESLRTGGVAKVSPTDVVAAIRAYTANWLGVSDIPKKLLDAMERHAEAMETPIGEDYIELDKLVRTREDSGWLSIIGFPGHYVTKERRSKLLAKMDGVWEILTGFQDVLAAWQQNWLSRASNPAAMMAVLTTALGGGRGAGILPGMNEPPETASVMDAAAGVIDAFNRMFAGFGIPAARAMAYEAVRVRKIVDDARIPAAVGASGKEDMLKRLDMGVSADWVRFERDVSKYVLGVYQLDKIPSDQLPGYIVALQTLGQSVPWSKLSNGEGPKAKTGRATVAGRTSDPVGRQSY